MNNSMNPQPGMNRPSGMIPPPGSGPVGSVPSPIQHHSPMPHGPIPQRPPIMSPMPPQQMVGSGLHPGPGMPPMMVQQQQQQQASQPGPMIGSLPQQMPMQHPQHPQMPIPHQQQLIPCSKSMICRRGVDIVQEIVAKTTELFQQLKSIPQLTNPNIQPEERKNKIKDWTKTIEHQFKSLRKIYEACNVCANVDFIDPKLLLPLQDDDAEDSEEEKEKTQDGMMVDEKETISLGTSNINEEKKQTLKYKLQEKEYQDLVELNRLKNRQLKEIIDRLRKVVWDINTMLAMRRP